MRRVIIKVFGILLLLLGTVAPRAAAGQVTLEKTLASFGYKVEHSGAVEPTALEKSEFDLQGKFRYRIKSLKPVSGEHRLYYRFSVDVETYQNDEFAQKRLERITATPPGPDTKMEADGALREGFRQGRFVYVVGTDVYKFALDKDLTRLRERLEKAVFEREAARKGILIGYIAARRSEAVEASRLLEIEGFRVTLAEYPSVGGGAVLNVYPTGTRAEAGKITKGLECIITGITLINSPNSPAQFGIDYLLTFGNK